MQRYFSSLNTLVKLAREAAKLVAKNATEGVVTDVLGDAHRRKLNFNTNLLLNDVLLICFILKSP